MALSDADVQKQVNISGNLLKLWGGKYFLGLCSFHVIKMDFLRYLTKHNAVIWLLVAMSSSLFEDSTDSFVKSKFSLQSDSCKSVFQLNLKSSENFWSLRSLRNVVRTWPDTPEKQRHPIFMEISNFPLSHEIPLWSCEQKKKVMKSVTATKSRLSERKIHQRSWSWSIIDRLLITHPILRRKIELFIDFPSNQTHQSV